jgi:hypothetical protein
MVTIRTKSSQYGIYSDLGTVIWIGSSYPFYIDAFYLPTGLIRMSARYGVYIMESDGIFSTESPCSGWRIVDESSNMYQFRGEQLHSPRILSNKPFSVGIVYMM